MDLGASENRSMLSPRALQKRQSWLHRRKRQEYAITSLHCQVGAPEVNQKSRRRGLSNEEARASILHSCMVTARDEGHM